MRVRWAVLIAVAVVIADQLTKAWIIASFPPGSMRQVIDGVLRLVHTRNRGVAFGMLGSLGPAAHTVLLVVVVAVVAVLAWQLHRSGSDGGASAPLAMVLGGALGNLTDRILRGEVVDFLDFYVTLGGREHHWPSFNVADACITVGAVLVILLEVIRSVRHRNAPSSH